MILEQLQTKSGENLERVDELTLSPQASPAKPLVLQENDKDLMTLEELCFLNLQERSNKSNHRFYSLRTSEGYYLTQGGDIR